MKFSEMRHVERIRYEVDCPFCGKRMMYGSLCRGRHYKTNNCSRIAYEKRRFIGLYKFSWDDMNPVIKRPYTSQS